MPNFGATCNAKPGFMRPLFAVLVPRNPLPGMVSSGGICHSGCTFRTSEGLPRMNVVSRATLLMAICSAPVFSQREMSEGLQPSFSTRYHLVGTDVPRPIGALSSPDRTAPVIGTSGAIERFTCNAYKNGSTVPLSFFRFNPCYATQRASATSRLLSPFAYTTGQHRFEYFPVKLGPLRYTFWSRNAQVNRPAGGRVQNLVDGVLRHYTSRPAVPVSETCLRWLACNNLYEQALRRAVWSVY